MPTSTRTMPAEPRHPARARDRDWDGGFTLVELLVVLLLVAILTTLAAPMARRALPGFELDATTETLVDALRLVRSTAIREGRDTWLTVDVGEGTYWRQGGPSAFRVPDGIAFDLLTAERERIDGETGRIRFFPDGSATGGTIVLSRGRDRRHVEVDWFDGRIGVDDDPQD